MASVFSRILSIVRRDPPQDAFGGEDLYDGDEEDQPKLSRRIAIAISGILFLGLIGLGGFVYWAGKDAPPPTVAMMPLAGLQVEDEEQPAPGAPAPAATPGAKQEAAVAATDRSNERRPWLSAPSQPGVADKPMAMAPPPPAPGHGKPEATITPPPAPAPLPPVAKAPTPGAVAKADVPPPPGGDAHGAPAAPPGAHDVMPSVLSKPEGPTDTHSEPQVAEDIPQANIAPGAPDRFIEKGDLAGSGRPRLVEPPLPPVDRASMNAPPPRFGNLAALKVKPTPTPDKAGKTGKVAIIVQGLGLSDSATEAAVTKLPAQVALSFSPYARDLRKWLQKAKDNGHEVLVEVPMESKQFPAEDPGPLGLMTTLQPKENSERLKTMLRLFPGAIGIDDVMGSKFRETEASMRDVYTALKDNKLVYVQGRPGVRIGEPGVPNTIADVVIDERPFRAAIDARLDYAERLAKYQGSTVTVMGAKPVSFERLALWLDQVDKRGIQLTPVSQVLVQ